ncbi:dynein regulation protein LC7 [Streptomyces oceani]|uniref:Dynein regulation protein LC7 n=2 Tax=Streptomyces oceani TaxID=1075402 RepID=A0A1E7KH18_9ACTN|nr:dynein regulation protein LC7 [Streptomyces oceani]
MLSDIVRVPTVQHALLISRDGLSMGRSASVTQDDADRISAVCAGLQSLGHEAAAQLVGTGSTTRQVMVEFDGGFLFLVAAGPGAALAVSTSDQVDAGLVAREMQQLVARVGEHLTSPPRKETTTP